MKPGLVIFIACALGSLWWIKARCRCPYSGCGKTFNTTAAVVRHVKRSHLS